MPGPARRDNWDEARRGHGEEPRIRPRPLPLLVSLLVALALPGCGGPEPEPERSIGEVEVMRGPFEPPADGVLTEALLGDYLEVMRLTRRTLEEQKTADILTPEGIARAREDRLAGKRRDKLLSTARLRAQMELGVNRAKLDWLERTVTRARAVAPDTEGERGASRRVLEPRLGELEEVTAGMR